MSLVQAVSQVVAVGSNAQSLTLTEGSLVYVHVDFNSNGSGPSVSTPSVSDGVNTYNLIGSVDGLAYDSGAQFYAKNVSAGAVTITVAFTAGVANAVTILEFSGIDTTNPLKSSAAANSTSGAITSGTLSPAAASGDLVVAGAGNYYDPGTWTPDTGFTIPAGATVTGGSANANSTAQYLIAGGSVTAASITPSTTTYGNIRVAVFSPAGATGALFGRTSLDALSISGPKQFTRTE